MKSCRVSLVGLIMVLLFAFVYSTPTFAQGIMFFPPVDSLNFVGSCVPPQMISHLHANTTGLDSIIIQPAFFDPLCTGFPPTPANTIPACYFIVHDSMNQFNYELWLRHSEPWYGSPVRLGFDTAYYLYPESFRLVLFVFQGSTIVDSASARFRSIQTGLSVDEDNSIPSSITLGQNYPNPFNPSTTISFSLQEQRDVSLKVFDLVGSEVATLLSQRLLRGDYQVQWHPMDLPSGVYLYRLQSGTILQSKKLIIIK